MFGGDEEEGGGGADSRVGWCEETRGSRTVESCSSDFALEN